MGSKKIALLFVVLANILLLGHSIIPHHHHDGLIHSINAQCHNENFNEHSHNNGDDFDCPLNDEILVPGKNIRSGADVQDERSAQGFFPEMNCALLDLADQLPISSYASNIYVHEISSQYLFLLSSPRGLRAPPGS